MTNNTRPCYSLSDHRRLLGLVTVNTVTDTEATMRSSSRSGKGLGPARALAPGTGGLKGIALRTTGRVRQSEVMCRTAPNIVFRQAGLPDKASFTSLLIGCLTKLQTELIFAILVDGSCWIHGSVTGQDCMMFPRTLYFVSAFVV